MEVRGVPVWDILALLAMGVGVWENSELVSASPLAVSGQI